MHARQLFSSFAVLVTLSTCSVLAQEDSAEAAHAPAADPWVVYEPQGEGAGAGKRIVFVTGDEEYRSEEGMPQLAKILATHHGFHCTVLFAIDPKTGHIAPDVQTNIPGLETLADADLMVIFTRFRNLPDAQMQHIVDYVHAGRPIVGLRTATHAFKIPEDRAFAAWSWRSKEWPGGFGRQVLGETWVAHHGAHGSESARGVIAPGQESHPIVRGIAPGTIWDPADVYTVRLPQPAGCTPIVMGQVLAGMAPDSPVLPPPPAPTDDTKQPGRDKNDPMMPLAWVRNWETPDGKSARVFATTLGSAPAFERIGSRRLIVNACYWALGLEDAIEDESIVDLVGDYEPRMFGFGKAAEGVAPADHAFAR